MQVGTFGTCDALHAIERIEFTGNLYYGPNQVLLPPTLQQYREEAYQFLRETWVNLTQALSVHGLDAVSAARYSRLLSGVIPTEKDVSSAEMTFRKLREIGLPLADHLSGSTIGWRWFLDADWTGYPARCGPTALVLEALISLDHSLPQKIRASLSDLRWLIDSAANYLCTVFESGYHATVEEIVVSASALRAYAAVAPSRSSETIRRRSALLFTKHLVFLEELFSALLSPMGLTTLRLTSEDIPASTDPLRPRRLKDSGFDIFLHGPLIPAFRSSPNPTHREAASIALRRALSRLQHGMDSDDPISTHWLSAVMDALPVAFDEGALLEQAPQREHARYLTVPGQRPHFFVITDTQFGGDSTAYRLPLYHEGPSFVQIQPSTFEQLVSHAARSLSADDQLRSDWSGLIHLGDVLCKGDYDRQGTVTVRWLRGSAEVLGIPTRNVVISPGNHDVVRSGLICDVQDLVHSLKGLKSRSRSGSSDKAVTEQMIRSINRHTFGQILPESGLACFRDVYSRLIEQHISPSDGGIEIVSFVAPRVIVHIVSVWPVIRYPIERRSKPREEYGIDPRAKAQVRDFLEGANPEDIVVLLSHVPAEHLTSWDTDQPDASRWIGAPAGDDMKRVLDFIASPAPKGHNQPIIHLIMSGHMQRNPKLDQFHGIWSYTAGAFHIRSQLSPGSFAARLIVDEGAIRIDTVQMRAAASERCAMPLIVAVNRTRLRAKDYDAHVIDTYDIEAEHFIEATDVPGKYVHLEKTRERFTNLLRSRFAHEKITVLDVGAGAGRDTEFFLRQGFQVLSIEGAPSLMEALRLRSRSGELAVHAANIIQGDALARVLADNRFHGIWMCATLVHVPAAGDLDGPSPLLTDTELIPVLAAHLALGGILYLDNKLGHGAHLKERGNVLRKRWFRYRQPHELQELLKGAHLTPLDSDWHNGSNGFDAWIWVLGELRS